MISLRAGTEEELPFIIPTWRKSFQEAQLAHSLGNLYLAKWSSVIQLLLSRSMTIIAFDEDAPDVVLGYIVYEYSKADTIIHYLYVRSEFQKAGIGTDLIHAVIETNDYIYTHRTTLVQKITMNMAEESRPTYDFTRIWMS